MKVNEWLDTIDVLEKDILILCSTDEGVYEYGTMKKDILFVNKSGLPKEIILNKEIDCVDILEENIYIWVKEELYK